MPEESLTVRRYRPSDGDRIRELHVRALKDDGAYAPQAPDDDLDDPIETYVESGGEFLVGEHSGKIVAMGGYRPAPAWALENIDEICQPAAQLKRMRVAPEYQRQGYGRTILERLEARANNDGYRELVLDTGAHQSATRAFYEAAGFTHDRTLTVDFEGLDLLMALYRKRLRVKGTPTAEKPTRESE